MTDHDKIVAHFFEAAGTLTEHAMRQLQAENPAAFAATAKAVEDGQPLLLSAVFGRGGIISTRLIAKIEGESVELMRLDGVQATTTAH
jgi:hypothetical protein